MAEVTITIGGRDFQVVCQEGQQDYLYSAAAMLDTEAQKLDQASSRLTESRMLMMAGLMLADRTAALEEAAKSDDTGALKTALEGEINRANTADSKLAAANQKIVELKAEKDALQTEIDSVNLDGGADMHAELSTARAEIEMLTGKLEAAEHAVELAQERFETMENDDSADGALDTAKSELSDAQSALANSEAKINELNAALEKAAELSAEQDDVIERAAGLDDELSSAKAEIETLNAKIAELDAKPTQDPEVITERDEAKSERDAAIAVRDELQDKLDGLTDERDEAINALRRIVTQIETAAE
ncbi:hypothetical protein GCM10008927_04610 [Amylibacter ulvae]|uniref:Cell division protein ZapA n=1 Tax=Paramylibacter ulvae TaxID=1651968 RepID=A0ABQ3CTH3_9RHOB|nr:cell division protein ZapA [Amylibacter ulvae]GHA43089.1 hypothetical protein GCM10008927_04610 [Amylibacter ulvae]